MNKYKILTEKLKQAFVDFYFYKDFEEYPYIDLNKTDFLFDLSL